jgi:hypothetical protein
MGSHRKKEKFPVAKRFGLFLLGFFFGGAINLPNTTGVTLGDRLAEFLGAGIVMGLVFAFAIPAFRNNWHLWKRPWDR